VIDSDYRGEVKLVLANLGDQPYRVEKGDRIVQLIIEKVDNRKLQEVIQLDDTERGDQGFWSSNTTMDQEVKGHSVKPPMEINEISAKAFGQFYRGGETTGILRWDEIEDEIQSEAINISTELAIKNKKIYPLSYDQLEELHRYIKQNENRGWIWRVKSGRGSPIMFVKKKDGKLRLGADYRALNEVTKKDRHPLPVISEALDRLGAAKYFTKVDIKDAYHNIRIRERDEWKTPVSTKLGTYEYLVIPLGLCNAPAAFQQWINEVLMEHIDMCCIVYLDDVLIYSNTLQQYGKDVANCNRYRLLFGFEYRLILSMFYA